MIALNDTQANTLKELAKEAITIGDAVNISGVVHSFSKAMSFLSEVCESTVEKNTHPISVLYAAKIEDLAMVGYGEDYGYWNAAYNECKRLAGI